MVTVSSNWDSFSVFATDDSNSNFYVLKDFKLNSHVLKILEMPGLSQKNSFWHRKIDHKVVWSRFRQFGTRSQFLQRTIVIRIFVSRKQFKFISNALNILEKPGLSQKKSFWHQKIYRKVVWSRFHPIGTQSRILQRTIVIQIFLSRKTFKLISHALKILEMPVLSRKNSFSHKKIDHKVVWSLFHPVGTQS
jgi:hypothetical protein